MNESQIIIALGGASFTILTALIGTIWSNLSNELKGIKDRTKDLESAIARLTSEAARSDERDKVFEKGIERLTKAIDDFDTRIGAQIANLSRIVDMGMRRYSPPAGVPKTREPYWGPPLKREEEK